MYTRRNFIKQSSITATAVMLSGKLFSASKDYNVVSLNEEELPRNILLRSGWQTENIGDIAHTPAMMALIEKYIPGAIVTFWPWYHYLPDNEIRMLAKRFPRMKLVQGKLDADGKTSTKELADAIADADFLLHNSAPATIAWENLATFKNIIGKPFGVYGVTYGLYGAPEQKILSEASFVYFRDSVSLQKAKDAGIHSPIMNFTPDAAFAIDVSDDEKAVEFLNANGLVSGKFICCIPKQRNTPVWLHARKDRPFEPVKHARNEEMKEHDHIPIREAIIAVVKSTQHKVLICHEDETEMAIGKEWLLDKLPEGLKTRIVWRNTSWLTDEAIGIYKRSAGLFGAEMHSPILCIAHGIPAIVVRWAEQSSKGMMWNDIGLSEWLFDFDNEEDIKRFVPTVLAMAKNPRASAKKAMKAKIVADSEQKKSMMEVEMVSRHTLTN